MLVFEISNVIKVFRIPQRLTNVVIDISFQRYYDS